MERESFRWMFFEEEELTTSKRNGLLSAVLP